MKTVLPCGTNDLKSIDFIGLPLVIGRKNWLFSGAPRGADACAIIFSLIETAKANGLEPYAYLRYLFAKLPFAKTVEDCLALLPKNLDKDTLSEFPFPS